MRHSVIDTIKDTTSYAEAAAKHGMSIEILREIVEGDIDHLDTLYERYIDDWQGCLDLIESNKQRGRVCAEWVWTSAGYSAAMAFLAKEEYLELVALVRSFPDSGSLLIRKQL